MVRSIFAPRHTSTAWATGHDQGLKGVRTHFPAVMRGVPSLTLRACMPASIQAPGVSRGIGCHGIPSLTLRACMRFPIQAPGVSRGIGCHGVPSLALRACMPAPIQAPGVSRGIRGRGQTALPVSIGLRMRSITTALSFPHFFVPPGRVARIALFYPGRVARVSRISPSSF
jgi:hypothetical protein